MKNTLLIFCCVLVLIGCQDASQKLPLTKRGFKYQHFNQVEANHPAPGDEAYFHYAVMAGDSLLTDSRPQLMAQKLIILPDSVITSKTHPFTDILPLMSVGDSTALYYPLDSFPKRPKDFDHLDDLTYVIKMEHILKEKEKTGAERFESVKELVEKDLSLYKEGQLENIEDLGNGLKAYIHEKGDGPKTQSGEYVSVHYYGLLESDGKPFDNSFARSSPIVFPLDKGAVIKGWDDGLLALTKGSRATLFIPYDLAYGEAGSPPIIPAKSNLVFYVEILK